ncbi:glycosyltransferase family 2 protein [Xanthobacteraceae bacterium Astr-EGSB]|uniref:glycosyltransferase family 2 protein n=1 Tax=Astrobacterium formosum TaxID=3069710 RepID=UPI0027B21D8B|nr:glycosyltransferase family 2 protein [Xanthobacteraceae bacterium Astr-EGSB]
MGVSAQDTASPERDIELSIVMPCLNERETIVACIAMARSFIERTGVSAEIVIADNGSTDGSIALAEENGARVVPVTERGYGAALMGGIAAARGRYVVVGDADLSYDFSRLDAFLAALRQGHDLVMGNRFRGGIADGAMPALHRYLGNPVLSLIGRVFFRVPIGDFHCGLRGFDRRRILDLGLFTGGMEFASEMVVAAALAGYSIVEVPTTLAPDGRSRPPHLRTWHDGWRHLRFLLMFSPRWLFLYPGAALMIVGIAAAVLLFPGSVKIGHLAFDTHTFLVAAISILVGMQIVCFGLIARRFAAAHGFLPKSKLLPVFQSEVTLERGLIAAGLIVAAGCLGGLWALTAWAAVDFGALNYPTVMRVLVLSLVAIAGGIQLAFTSFLLGIMDIPLTRRRPEK